MSQLVSTKRGRLRNTSGGPRYFGYLPGHGVQLANGALYTSAGGSLIEDVREEGGSRGVASLLTDISTGKCAIYDGQDGDVVEVDVASATVINAGDMVQLAATPLATTKVTPISSIADTGSLAGNQAAVHDALLGVALTSSANGETTPVVVATRGVHEFPCTSATYSFGQFVGAKEDAGGTVIQAQGVVGVATLSLAVARVVKAYPSATLKVLAEIKCGLVT